MFEKIKKWYLMNLWTKEMVHNALLKDLITESQYNEIIKESEL